MDKRVVHSQKARPNIIISSFRKNWKMKHVLENFFNKIHPFWSTDEIREGNLFLSSFLLPPPTHPLPLCPESQLLRVHRRQSSQGDLPSTTDR
jgi:hypothetical protein